MPYRAVLKPQFPLKVGRRRAGTTFTKEAPVFFEDEIPQAILDDEWIDVREITDSELEKYREFEAGNRPSPDIPAPKLALDMERAFSQFKVKDVYKEVFPLKFQPEVAIFNRMMKGACGKKEVS